MYTLFTNIVVTKQMILFGLLNKKKSIKKATANYPFKSISEFENNICVKN